MLRSIWSKDRKNAQISVEFCYHPLASSLERKPWRRRDSGSPREVWRSEFWGEVVSQFALTSAVKVMRVRDGMPYVLQLLWKMMGIKKFQCAKVGCTRQLRIKNHCVFQGVLLNELRELVIRDDIEAESTGKIIKCQPTTQRPPYFINTEKTKALRVARVISRASGGQPLRQRQSFHQQGLAVEYDTATRCSFPNMRRAHVTGDKRKRKVMAENSRSAVKPEVSFIRSFP